MTIKTKKITFKKAESEWYSYHETLKEIAKLRAETIHPTPEQDDNTGGGKSGMIDRPTERIAIRLMTHKQLVYLDEVASCIDRVYNALPPGYKKLVQLRYWNHQDILTWDMLADKLNVSERQARRWCNAIIQATMEVLGWR